MILYAHVSPNGKLYFGITQTDVNVRWGNSGTGYKHNQYFWRAIQKYGWDNFQHIVLADNLSKEWACKLEQDLIWKYQTQSSNYGYNLSAGGEFSAFGMKHTEETKQRISKSGLGRSVSQETREKLSRVNKGKHLSDEQKEKLRLANLGKKLSEETRQKISQSGKGKRVGKDNPMFGKGLSGELNGMYGKHHTEETKQKLSEMNRGENNHFYGQHHTKETKKRLSESHKGLKYGKQSEEHIRKRVEARRRTLEAKKKLKEN